MTKSKALWRCGSSEGYQGLTIPPYRFVEELLLTVVFDILSHLSRLKCKIESRAAYNGFGGLRMSREMVVGGNGIIQQRQQ
jgi:hypothetical protein